MVGRTRVVGKNWRKNYIVWLIDGITRQIISIIRPISHQIINQPIINGSWLVAHGPRPRGAGPAPGPGGTLGPAPNLGARPRPRGRAGPPWPCAMSLEP